MPRIAGSESNRQQWCLTYPQTNLTPEELLAYLTAKTTQHIEQYFIQQEEHKNGAEDQEHGLHLHAYIKLKKGFGKSSPAALLYFNHPQRTAHISRDVDGKAPSKSFIWNYLLKPNKEGVIRYITNVSISFI